MSSAKPTGIDDTKFAGLDTPIRTKLKDQGILETSMEVGKVTYSIQLNPEQGSVICEKSSSDPTELTWEVWGHELRALGADFNRVRAAAQKHQTFDTFATGIQALQESARGPEFQALAARLQALQESAQADRLEAKAAEEIGNRINFSVSRHILGLEIPELQPEWLDTIEAMDLKTTDAIDRKTTEELEAIDRKTTGELEAEGINKKWLKHIKDMESGGVSLAWVKVVKEMEKLTIEANPHMLQMNLTEVTIPVDDETKNALELFASHVFESQADPKSYPTGSELHKVLLGTQSGQDVSSLLSNVLPGRKVTEITPARDKIKFTLGPDPDFWWSKWKAIEWKQITSDEGYTDRQIDSDTLENIDKPVGPNKRREVEDKLREMQLPEKLAETKRELNETLAKYEELINRHEHVEILAERHAKLETFRQKLEEKSASTEEATKRHEYVELSRAFPNSEKQNLSS